MAKPKNSETGGAKAGILSTLIAFALVSLCAGGIGFLSGTQVRSLQGAGGAKSPVLTGAKVSRESFQVVTLPSIVTNLGGTEGGWVRLEAAVLVEGRGTVPADLASRLAQDTTALLRTLSVRQISGASGFQHLREELMDRMKTRSSDRVREILIQSLVIE